MEIRTDEIRQLPPSNLYKFVIVGQMNSRHGGEALLIRDDAATLPGKRYFIVGWSWKTGQMTGGGSYARSRTQAAVSYVHSGNYTLPQALYRWERGWKHQDEERAALRAVAASQIEA